MKTLQELYMEVMSNEELKKQFVEVAKSNKQLDFIKGHGCDTTLDELKVFIEEKANEDKPLNVNELENAVGGYAFGKGFRQI